MRCKLTKYGRREIAIATVAAAGLCAVVGYLAAAVSALIWPVVALPAAGWLYVLWFFRDPDRTAPDGEHLFVSPADGVVTDITEVGSDCPLGRAGVKIGVFMNIFDVHVNRAPASGCVERTEHSPGGFVDVRNMPAAENNESATIYLTLRRGRRDYPLVVRQIAGLIARRIVTDLRPGEVISRGQRIGMIKFGSRLELLVPRELVAQVRVDVGQRVVGGRSVLAAAPQEFAE